MAGRYQELYRLPVNLYLEGSPVLVEAGALQKDLTEDKVVAQLKLRNLSAKKIIACKVSVHAFEPNGNEVQGIKDFAYLDINVARDQEFGVKTPIYLPDKITRKISVAVTEVVFGDNSMWSAEEKEWTTIPAQKQILESIRDSESLKQYYIEVGEKLPFIPEIKRGLFLCACGNINLESDGKCGRCGRKYEDLCRIIDQEYLNAKKDARLKKEREEKEEKERQAELARIEREKKEQEAREEKERQEELARLKRGEIKRKILRFSKVAIPVFVGIVSVILVFVFLVTPMIKYNKATTLMERGQYEEAKSVLEDLDGFGGSYRKLTILYAMDQIDIGDCEKAIKNVLQVSEPVALQYNLNGGYSSSGDTFYYKKASDFSSLLIPQKEGYKFDKWKVSDYSYSKEDSLKLILDAVWSDEYRISYNLDGGKANNPTEYHKEGKAITLINPTKEGYTFVGWTGTDIDGMVSDVMIPSGSYGDREYTANWEAYGKITYKLGGGRALNPSEYSFQDKTFTLNNPTREGYTFIGWTGTDLDGLTMTVTIPTGSHGDRKYTANWEVNEYKITLDAKGGKVNNSIILVTYDSSYSLPTPERDYYAFDGWYSGAQKYQGGTWFTPKDIELEAKWNRIVYKVDYYLDGGSNASQNPTRFTVESAAITLKDPTRKGYKFAGWYGDKAYTKKINQIAAGSHENITLYAKWEIINYTITYDLNGGNISGNKKASFTINDLPLSLPSATKSGLVFLNWGKDTYDGVPVEKITDIGDVKLVASYVDPDLQFGYSKDGTYCGVVSYSGTATSLDIPAYYNGVPVRVINADAFKASDYSFNSKSTLENVRLPKTISVIGSSAFENCIKLKTINIPAGVIELKDYTFTECKNLISIELPGSLKTIGYDCFAGCKALKDILLPSSLTEIGNFAFSGCSSLQNITIPGSLKQISIGAFEECTGLESVFVNEGVTVISNVAFSGCSKLKNIILPTTLKRIGGGAFINCVGLTKIIIPENVTYIEVTLISDEPAFDGCSNLTIYCRSKMVQSGWEKGWNDDCPIVLGYTGN